MQAGTVLMASALLALVGVQAQAQTPKAGVPQFQVYALWPKDLPNNWLLGQVSGITTDRNNNVWIVNRPGSLSKRERAAEQNPPEAKCCAAPPAVIVFDQAGNVIKHWGGPGQGYNWPKSEHGIYIDDNDFVWLDSNATDRLGSPADIAVDVAAKEVYAADGYTNRRVVVFDSETGAYKRHWGAYGKRPSDEKQAAYDPSKPPSQQFGNPVHCVRIAKDGLVYVCDRTNDRLQVFRKDGTFVAEHFFEKETRMNGSVYEIAFSPDPEQKYIYMVDGSNGEIRIVERSNMQTVGRFGRIGRQAGQFTAVHNITVDRLGNIYTAEVQTGQRIQKFRRLDTPN